MINLGSGNLINLELSGDGSEQPRQGRVESARGHRRQPEGADRAGHGDSVRHAGHRRTRRPTVQFKKAVLELDGDAADHARQPDHHAASRSEGLGRASWSTCRAAVQVPSIDTRNVTTQIAVNNGDTAVIGGIYEGRHRATTSTRFRSSATCRGRLPVQDARGAGARRPELLIFLTPRVVRDSLNASASVPRSSQRQSAERRAARASRSPRLPRPPPLQSPPVHLHRGNLFLVGCRARASPRSAASSRAVSTRRFVDADARARAQARRDAFRRSSRSKARRGFRDREEAIARRLDALSTSCSCHRRRRRDATGEPRASEGERHGDLSARDAGDVRAQRTRHSRTARLLASAQTRWPSALVELYARAIRSIAKSAESRDRKRTAKR